MVAVRAVEPSEIFSSPRPAPERSVATTRVREHGPDMPLTVLAEPSLPPEDLSTDVLAIHDLLALDKQSIDEPGKYLTSLQDCFDYQRSRCRLLIYQYDARALLTPGSGSELTLFNQATLLAHELVAEREGTAAESRPLIFLCHGFGGILAKRALVLSRQLSQVPSRLHALWSSTYALIFVGTPHHGICHDALEVLYRGSSTPPNQFILDLLRGSELIEGIEDCFRPLINKVRIFNFWEQIRTNSGTASALIVDEESAAPLSYTAERSGIRSDHADLLSFSDPDSTALKVVLGALDICIRGSASKVMHRENAGLRAAATSTQIPPLPAQGHAISQNDIAARTVHLGDVYNYNIIGTDRSVPHSDGASSPKHQAKRGLADSWPSDAMYKVERSSIPQFTGRRLQAEILSNGLSAPGTVNNQDKHRIAVIYGLGGSGKTQFCLKFAEQQRRKYWGVFWIDASTRANAEAGYSSLGLEAGKGATPSAGKFWLSQQTKPWLLIIDNADEPEMDVSDFFPTGNCGHILISTRNPNVTIHANAASLRFRGMDAEDGIDLLLRSAYPSSQVYEAEPGRRSLASSIAAELGYLAIALDQAGTTIRRNIYTLETYLRSYLGYRYRLLHRREQIYTSEANVITTWEIPFRQIELRYSREFQDAVILMHIFAFLHFESISEDIFYASWTSVETPDGDLSDFLRLDSRQLELSQVRLRHAIRVLCDYSIVEYDSRRGTCTLHPVVHRWARTRLAEKNDVAIWLDRTAQLLTRCISPYLEASGYRFRRSLLPHLDACVELLRSNSPAFPGSPRVANQMERFASLYADVGKWHQAIRLQREILNYRVRLLGKSDEATLRAQRAICDSLWNLFRVREVIDIQKSLLFYRWWSRRALAEWIPLWRPDHITYCIALDDLTQSLWLAGLRRLSQRAGERALEGLLKRLGPDDPLTLKAMFNLGRTYRHLGETQKGHTLLVTALKKRRAFFGPDHPETLMSRNELGMSLCSRNQHLAAAEQLVTNVIKARKRILGEEHAYTLWSINDLSKILCERDRPAEAAFHLESIIPIVERTLGQDHVGMSMTKGNLARAYVKSQRWSDGEAVLSQMLNIIEDDHPDWTETIYGYAHVKIGLGKLSEARDSYERLLQSLERREIVPDIAQTKMIKRLHDQLIAAT